MRIICLFALASNVLAFAPTSPSNQPMTQLFSKTWTAYDALPPKPYHDPKDEAPKTDEVKETARALFRVFQLGDNASGNDYPSLSKPTGWSGEVGSGPMTAYDCLPPKKWVAPVAEEEPAEVAEMKAKTDEVRETVRALYRVFQLGDEASGNDYPALSRPTGWSGEVGDGPKTAYDCLPPKKYNP